MSATPDEKGIHEWQHVSQFPENLKKYANNQIRKLSETDKTKILVSALQDLGAI
jgi:hypothetical protein